MDKKEPKKKSPVHLDLFEIEQIKVLKAGGLTDYAIAKKVGRDRKTVKRCYMDPRNAEEIEAIQGELAGYFEDLTMRLITSITDEEIIKLNVYQRVIAAGIAVDKFRLLRNESTEKISIDVINISRERVRERLIELEKKKAKRSGVDYEAKRIGKPVENETHDPVDDVEKVEISEPKT